MNVCSPTSTSNTQASTSSLLRSLRNSALINNFSLPSSTRKFHRPKAQPASQCQTITLPLPQLHVYSLCGTASLNINGEDYVHSSYRPTDVLVSESVHINDIKNDPMISKLSESELARIESDKLRMNQIIAQWPEKISEAIHYPQEQVQQLDLGVD
jgi:hypothetical protein